MIIEIEILITTIVFWKKINYSKTMVENIYIVFYIVFGLLLAD